MLRALYGGASHLERRTCSRITPLWLFIISGWLLFMGQPLSARAQIQVLSGSYTGNGTDRRSITAMYFQPDVIIIKGNTTQDAVIRTSSMTGDTTKDMAAVATTSNLIESLDTKGFTVGTDARVNSNDVTYYWVAFKAAAGEMQVGSYIGNGTPRRSITGVGFRPGCVAVLPATADPANFKTSYMAGDLSEEFRNNKSHTDQIFSLDADGFTVGNTKPVNNLGTTYYYVAWKVIAGKMNLGSYTGNGTDNRSFTGMGFQPEYMFIKNHSTSTKIEAVHKTASTGSTTDTTFSTINEINFTSGIESLDSDGFQVGSDNKVNQSAITYYWVAFARLTTTAVKLSSFTATEDQGRVLLQFATRTFLPKDETPSMVESSETHKGVSEAIGLLISSVPGSSTKEVAGPTLDP